jgi:hypothetical protein
MELILTAIFILCLSCADLSLAADWCGRNCLGSQLRNTVDDRRVPEFGTYVANISVNMAQYGNTNVLDL